MSKWGHLAVPFRSRQTANSWHSPTEEASPGDSGKNQSYPPQVLIPYGGVRLLGKFDPLPAKRSCSNFPVKRICSDCEACAICLAPSKQVYHIIYQQSPQWRAWCRSSPVSVLKSTTANIPLTSILAQGGLCHACIVHQHES